MTGADHQHSETVITKAQWLAEQNPNPTSIIPAIRERFGLSVLEECGAVSLSNKNKIWRRTFA